MTQINYIIKARAYRYVAATEKSWLFPEKNIDPSKWKSFGEDYLFMPDPRSVSFSSETIIGYKNKKADFFDAYGRKPWQTGYDDKAQRDREWETFHAFLGEYARRFGPVRRGLSYVFGNHTPEDSEEYYKYLLSLESTYKKHRYRPRKKNNHILISQP